MPFLTRASSILDAHTATLEDVVHQLVARLAAGETVTG
jgi:hypothetical protein